MRKLAATLVAGAALLAACGGSGTGGSNADSGGSNAGGDPSRSITVFAAASLQKTFTIIGDRFETENAGTKVDFSFAGSSDLVSQITQGAPADVFASADTANMTKVTDAKLVSGTPTDFATNILTIVVPPSNPAKIASFADLGKPGAKVVLCAPQVPCGAAAKKVENLTGSTIKPVSEESQVTDVLNKVTSGEADAGLVYVTDAKGAGANVDAISFPQSTRVVNTYPIAVLTAAKQPDLARQFAAFVAGPEGQQVLRNAGFGAP
jgi:molybdate transport system substrate-binding protein